jgi:predicted nucleic acid-binding protein
LCELWIQGIFVATQRLFREVVSLCRSHQGRLNFHDSLMALACQELDIRFIVSFDPDFDALNWLTRLAEPGGAQVLRE